MFLDPVINFFRSVKAKVSALFVLVFGQDAAQKFADGTVALLKTAAGVLAIDAVKFAATLQLGSSEETRSAAVQKLANDAQTQGITLTNSLVNLLIELAVQAAIKKNILPA